jgi:hypothetical protein
MSAKAHFLRLTLRLLAAPIAAIYCSVAGNPLLSKHSPNGRSWLPSANTGNYAVLYMSPSAIFKVTSRLTAYPNGNANATKGNHQFPGELGDNFNSPF